jgi:beta-galactosidase/beta-glucuronidase
VCADHWPVDYPRPNQRRSRWTSLDGEWEFGAGETKRFDRRIRVPFCPQSELSGVHELDPGDVVWYLRRFAAPPAERLVLHFGAVDYRATVSINGEEVASHEGGHTPFSVDVTHVAGRDDNEVVVRVEDPLADRTIPRGKQHWTTRPEGIFYTATTGIWQTVWLEPLPERCIESLRVTPDLDAGAVDLQVEPSDIDVTVTFGGRVVGRRRGSGSVRLAEVHAWSPETPDLYELHIALGDSDEVATYFGLRTVETRDGMFWLNHRPYVQRLVLDQGYFPGGLMTAPSPGDFVRDIRLAKSLGFNGARKHQKIEDPRYLYWADRLGFLVWAEMPSLREASPAGPSRLAAEWERAVLRDRDHPCVVVWAPINETDGLGPDPAPFLDRIYQMTRRLDHSRPVVSNDGWEQATTDICTLHDYSSASDLARRYRTLESALEPSCRARPPYLPGYGYRGEPVIVSEFGGVALSGSGGWGYAQAAGAATLLETYREMVEALMAPGPVAGFCYTQLYDVEQERNGLLTFQRKPKVDPGQIRQVTLTPKHH